MKETDIALMSEALVEAQQALTKGEFPVGCVLARNGRILARGHRVNSGAAANELDHAEVVCLRSLIRREPALECGDLTCYSTMEPCLMCYATLLLSGIRRFVWAYEDVMGGGLNLPLYQLSPLYATMEVEITGPVLRRQSLALFQQFFRAYPYWEGSLLANYTLAQPLGES